MLSARSQAAVPTLEGSSLRPTPETVATIGGTTTSPAIAITAGYTNTGVIIGSRPIRATRKASRSMTSRSHHARTPTNTIADETRTASDERSGTASNRTPASNRGRLQRYAAPSAQRSARIASTAQTGRVRLQITSGSSLPRRRAGRRPPRRLRIQPAAPPARPIWMNRRHGCAYHGWYTSRERRRAHGCATMTPATTPAPMTTQRSVSSSRPRPSVPFTRRSSLHSASAAANSAPASSNRPIIGAYAKPLMPARSKYRACGSDRCVMSTSSSP